GTVIVHDHSRGNSGKFPLQSTVEGVSREAPQQRSARVRFSSTLNVPDRPQLPSLPPFLPLPFCRPIDYSLSRPGMVAR
ncbi:MAG: hypothetical protein AAB093_00020, partial [Nitrospirota bacterium]